MTKGDPLDHVSLSPSPPADRPSVAGPSTALVLGHPATSVTEALALGVELAALGAVPGDGSTRDQWEALATVAARDLGAARALEPHLDAVSILREAGSDVPAGTWGVFAAEGGDEPLTAVDAGGSWSLTGVKPWCSLADRLDRGLVTASVGNGERRLFDVALSDPGVSVLAGAWAARGLIEIPSGPVRFDAVSAEPVGAPGWYLERPGFAWGGLGVAACWYGGAVGIGRTVYDAAASKPNPHLLTHLGAIDELLQSARRALAEAGDLVDARADGGRLLAKRTRATVARVCEEVIERAGHALGPAPLALDEAHAKRVADLTLYVRQHHAERDQQSLGETVVSEPVPW